MLNLNNSQKKRHLSALTVLMFLNMLGYSILIPIIPTLFINKTNPFYILPSYISDHYSFILQGLLLAIYAVFVFLSSPVLGELSDYYGRKKILNISFFGSAIGFFLFALAIYEHNIWILFLSRIVDGITGGNISVMQASTIDVSSKEERAKNIARRSSVMGIAFILGPWIGGMLSSSDVSHFFTPATPFIFAGLLSLIAVFIINKFLFETVNVGHEDHAHKKFSLKSLHPFNSLKIIRDGYKIGNLRVFFNVMLIFFIGFGMYSSFSQNLLSLRFGFDEKSIGYYFAYTGILMTIIQIFIIPRFKNLSPEKILSFSLPVLAFLFVIYGAFINNIYVLLVFVFIMVIFIGLNMVNTNVAIADHATEGDRGKIFGITSSVQSLAQVIAPILGGFVAAYFSYSAPFYFSAFFLILAAIFLWNYKEKRNI
ncbi:MAG: MFS transporter [Candidatus Paceibacterota bacterium]|jgi:MFS family permease